jgi:hypothetical protein
MRRPAVFARWYMLPNEPVATIRKSPEKPDLSVGLVFAQEAMLEKFAWRRSPHFERVHGGEESRSRQAAAPRVTQQSRAEFEP